MRPAFSRNSTFLNFVISFIAIILRTDHNGVTSLIRALDLYPGHYTSICDFFKSTGWSTESLLSYYWKWIRKETLPYTVDNRIIMSGDHTKNAKDGRKIPAVTTLHQDSETNTKPSYFRGHHWGCISLILNKYNKYFSLPLKANIQEGLETIDHPDKNKHKSTWIVEMAIQAAQVFGKTILVLDAFFSVGPVFKLAANYLNESDEQLVHIITRAKKSYRAFEQPKKERKTRRGPKRKYGKEYRLINFFDRLPRKYKFETEVATIYGKNETIKFLALNLIWKPLKSEIRFIWVETSRGRMILMCSDLKINPITAIELYCTRVSIETMFSVLKNVLGGFKYHFWSSFLSPASRRPVKKDMIQQVSSNKIETLKTFFAIEKFVNLNIVVLGFLQLISIRHTQEVKQKSVSWFRTTNNNIPSENVTKLALANEIRKNIQCVSKMWIIDLIIERMKKPKYGKDYTIPA